MQPLENFRQIYERQANRVYRLALMYLGNVPDAEDIVQSVFLKLLEKQPVFENEAQETAWLVTVARNRCKDVLKSFWRRNRAEFPQAEEAVRASFTEKDSLVFSALAALPGKYRETLYLYYIEGYSVRELSVLLKRKESTLQTWLAAGRKRMKEQLSGFGFEKKEMAGKGEIG